MGPDLVERVKGIEPSSSDWKFDSAGRGRIGPNTNGGLDGQPDNGG